MWTRNWIGGLFGRATKSTTNCTVYELNTDKFINRNLFINQHEMKQGTEQRREEKKHLRMIHLFQSCSLFNQQNWTFPHDIPNSIQFFNENQCILWNLMFVFSMFGPILNVYYLIFCWNRSQTLKLIRSIVRLEFCMQTISKTTIKFKSKWKKTYYQIFVSDILSEVLLTTAKNRKFWWTFNRKRKRAMYN